MKTVRVVGFTGTKRGMSPLQARLLKETLEHLKPTEFHHGDCVGADVQAHDIAYELSIPIIIHPPADESGRAWCDGWIELHARKPYLQRNHDIVDVCDILIATPQPGGERLRSGTWATIRYAMKVGKELKIL